MEFSLLFRQLVYHFLGPEKELNGITLELYGKKKEL
jgi:hypothetical protein